MTLLTDRTTAAARHLHLLRGENDEKQTRLYVSLAHNYGLTPALIADYADMPVERVREILAED